MGSSYGNGFLFMRQPNWDGMVQLNVPCKCVAFKHIEEPLWFACICDSKTAKRSKDLHPTMLPPPRELRANFAACDRDATSIIQSLEAIATAIDNNYVTSGITRIHACLEVANVTGSPVMYIEADDEFVDRACLAEPAKLKAFRIRQCTDDLSAEVELRYEKSKLSVIIGGQNETTEALLGICSELRGVKARQPTKAELMPRELFSTALAIWPKTLGDAAELLGLGTPEPMDTVGELFVPVKLDRPKGRR